MSVIRVQPDSIRQYAATAQSQFDEIRNQLQGLVADAVNVRYFGPNAVDFKTRCGQIAADFALRLGQDLAQIADAVRVSTTNIAASLGGSPLSIAVNAASIPLPQVPVGDGSVEIETGSLEGLKAVLARRIEVVQSQLEGHLRNLSSTDWQGQAKEHAVTAVTGFTNTAKSRVLEAQLSLASYVDSQIADVLASDR